MNKTIFSLIMAIVLLNSCKSEKHYFIDMKALNKDQWAYKDTLVFKPVIKEKGAYRIALAIRYNADYEFSNVWIKYRQEKEVRVDVPLFQLDGTPIGECSGGLCTQYGVVKDSVVLDADTLEIKLVQNMRRNPLKNITDAGIIIDKLN